MKKEMLEERSWEEFRRTGLSWWINRTLHLFGWAIVMEMDQDGKPTRVYPARCKYRGFPQEKEEEGFLKLTSYIKEVVEELNAEVRES